MTKDLSDNETVRGNRGIEHFLDQPYLPITDTIPTWEPENNGSIIAYESGVTRRLYIYINTAWRYITLT